jgi:nucleoside-diphosphate-sugar epimerase
VKVLITGGTGFIGSRLALDCLRRGDSVLVLGQQNNVPESENRQLIESNGAKVSLVSVTDRDALFKLLPGIDLVYHLAAAQHEANVPEQRFWDVNVKGTTNVLEASIHAGVKRFVHGSTIGVYGSALEGKINEDSPLRPDNIYGVTKLEAEKLVLSFKDRIPVVVIRISETYGPGDRRLLKLFRGIKKSFFFKIGSGKNLHHPIFIADLIEGLVLASASDAAVGKIFVLAGKEAVTTNQMVDAIAERLGTQIPKLRLPLSPLLFAATVMETVLRPMGIQPPLHRRRMDFFRKSFVFLQEKSLKQLGFIPKFSFKQGVEETFKWYDEMGYLS